MIILAEVGLREPKLFILPTSLTSSQTVFFHSRSQRVKLHSLSLVTFLPATGQGSGCWHTALLPIVRQHQLCLAWKRESWHCPGCWCLQEEAEDAGYWQTILLPPKLGMSGQLQQCRHRISIEEEPAQQHQSGSLELPMEKYFLLDRGKKHFRGKFI